MKDKGTLVVISGFSGAGKGTICKSLLEHMSELAISVSMTTRKPRVGETQEKANRTEESTILNQKMTFCV